MDVSNNVWEVTTEESGTKLLTFLKNKLGETISSRQIKRAIEENLCVVNGITERFSTTQLGTGDRVALHMNRLSKPTTVSLFEKERLLFEDGFLLIYNKPGGVASDDPEFLKALRRYCPTLILIHRLDRDTTGALLFSKNSAVQANLITLFKQHLVKKEYLALVDGIPKKKMGVIDNFLGEKHRRQGEVSWGKVAVDKGVRAITEWKCLSTGSHASLLRCIPKTGRTHQIRVHLSEMGHPLLGDFQYGRTFQCPYRPARHLLHAYTLSFPHPCTTKQVSVSAPLPEDFEIALKLTLEMEKESLTQVIDKN